MQGRRQKKLEKYVRKYFRAHPEVKLIVVSGSIGKTTAKTAIATVLAEKLRVRLFHGNRSAGSVSPMAILGIDYPGEIKGFMAWRKIYRAARKRIQQPADVDVIIHELNTPVPGSVDRCAGYILPDGAVITAVSANNLENFHNIDAIAQEQLKAVNFSKFALINRDTVDGAFSQYLTNSEITTFGTNGAAEYRFEEEDFDPSEGYKGYIVAPELSEHLLVSIRVFDEFSLQLVVSAVALGVKFGLSPDEIVRAVQEIRPTAGRVNILQGSRDSLILDDTANTSPLGAVTGLRALYQVQAPQRIAVFGDMLHLGNASQQEHEALGQLCDPSQLAWVVTVGPLAEQYVAPVARSRGCQVRSFRNALEAGAFVHGVMEAGSAVLFNGADELYLEEAVKITLHSAQDENKLVRQDPEMLRRKAEFFSHF